MFWTERAEPRNRGPVDGIFLFYFQSLQRAWLTKVFYETADRTVYVQLVLPPQISDHSEAGKPDLSELFTYSPDFNIQVREFLMNKSKRKMHI